MRRRPWTGGLLGGFALLLALACAGPEETRWDDAAEQIEIGQEAPAGDVIEGDTFNAMLPEDGFRGHRRVFTQEKEGYAEAEYQKDGLTVVTVSISDTRDNPSAREKFARASDTVGGHPAMERGDNTSVVLVGDRFQVRASSTTLGPEARREWLGAANLDQLATLH